MAALVAFVIYYAGMKWQLNRESHTVTKKQPLLLNSRCIFTQNSWRECIWAVL